MILLDTDVLIDIALDRHPHVEPASTLIDKIEFSLVPAVIAWHSMSNLYYPVSPTRGEANTRNFIRELIDSVPIATTGTDSIRYTTKLPITDFEDAMQVAATYARQIVRSSPATYVTMNDPQSRPSPRSKS